MQTGMQQAKEPVSPLLAGPYGHPYHPMLVTVPIGAWVISLGFDIASHLVRQPGFLTEGSEWLIAVGVAGAIVAGAAGFLDFGGIPQRTAAFRTACTHMCINVVLIFAYAANFAWRWHIHSRNVAVGAGMLVLSAASVAALSVSGYLGGTLAFRYGVRVATEDTQADGYLPASRR